AAAYRFRRELLMARRAYHDHDGLLLDELDEAVESVDARHVVVEQHAVRMLAAECCEPRRDVRCVRQPEMRLEHALDQLTVRRVVVDDEDRGHAAHLPHVRYAVACCGNGASVLLG